MNNEVVSRAEAYLEYAQKIRNDYPEPVARMDYHLLSVAELVRLGGADVQTIKDAVNDYLAANPPATMTDTQIADSVNRSIADGSISVGSGTTDYADLTNKPSINGVELNGDKSLSDLGITSYDDTQVKSDIATNNTDIATNKSDIADLKTDKQDKIDNTLNTTDKTVIGAINEIYGTQLDTVGFSADYKNIILNRKNGLNPYTIPIASIIHNASLTELKDVDSTDIGNGKTLVYDSALGKHKYVSSSSTDELVKMEASTDSKYLCDLIDKSTIVNDNGTLKVKKLDGQNVTIAEINYLKGLTMNVMDLVNMFSNGGVKIINTPVATYADLLAYDKSSLIDGISYLVYVLADETHDNAKTTYLIDKTSSTPTYFGFAGEHRDFTTSPIDLANEVTGKLGTSNIDVDALWKLLTINDTYKTLTTNNEVFGTHGAKALYDELVTAIGGKANTTDLEAHTNDTDIHVSTTDKEKWDKVTDKVDKTDIVDSLTSTYIDKPLSANQGKVLKDEVDLKANDDEVVKKTDITTTINNTSTDEQIPSAKSVYDKLIANKKIINYPYSSTKITMQEACDNNNVIKTGISIFYAGAIISDTPAIYGTMIFCKEWRYSAFVIDGLTGYTYSAIIYGSGEGPFTFKGWKRELNESDIGANLMPIFIDSFESTEFKGKLKTVYGFTEDSTIQDIITALNGNSNGNKGMVVIYTNSNNSNFNKSLPYQGGGNIYIFPASYGIQTNYYERCTVVFMPYTKNTGSGMFINPCINGTLQGWSKVCTTTVADVPKTLITISDETNYKNSPGSESFYVIRDGICYVTLAIDCVSPLSNVKIADLPKAYGGIFRFSMSKADSAIDGYVLQDGTLKLSAGTENTKYYVGTFSYPVAES